MPDGLFRSCPAAQTRLSPDWRKSSSSTTDRGKKLNRLVPRSRFLKISANKILWTETKDYFSQSQRKPYRYGANVWQALARGDRHEWTSGDFFCRKRKQCSAEDHYTIETTIRLETTAENQFIRFWDIIFKVKNPIFTVKNTRQSSKTWLDNSWSCKHECLLSLETLSN